MVIDPVFHLRAGRELPRPPGWSHLDGGLQAVAEEIPPWWKLPHLPAAQTLFLWFFLMLGVAVGLLVLAVWLRRRDGGADGSHDDAARRRASSASASSRRASSARTPPTCCG